jgi:hypothetical protein
MKKIFFYILVFNFTFVFAQDSIKTGFPSSIEVQAGYGFIGKHTDILGYYITGHVPNININVGKKLKGNKQWHKLYNYPEIGFGYYFAMLNNKYLGNVHAVYSYINIPLTSKEKKLSPNLDFSIGLSYFPKPFDIIDNYQNRIIGTHFNVYFKLGLGLEYKISDKLTVNSIFGVNHYSNAKVKTPNLGINVLNFNLGLRYNFKNHKIINKEFEVENYKKNEIIVVYSAGMKATPKPLNRRYYASAFVIDYYRHTSQKSKLGGGLDLFYDGSQEYYYQDDSITNRNWYDKNLLGTHLSYGLIVNKVTFTFQVGYYLYDRLNINGNIYSRLGFRTYLTDKLLLNLTLKTHFAKADLLEIGIGYRIF